MTTSWLTAPTLRLTSRRRIGQTLYPARTTRPISAQVRPLGGSEERAVARLATRRDRDRWKSRFRQPRFGRPRNATSVRPIW